MGRRQGISNQQSAIGDASDKLRFADFVALHRALCIQAAANQTKRLPSREALNIINTGFSFIQAQLLRHLAELHIEHADLLIVGIGLFDLLLERGFVDGEILEPALCVLELFGYRVDGIVESLRLSLRAVADLDLVGVFALPTTLTSKPPPPVHISKPGERTPADPNLLELLGSPEPTAPARLARRPVTALAHPDPHPGKSPRLFRRQGIYPFRMWDLPGQQFRFLKEKCYFPSRPSAAGNQRSLPGGPGDPSSCTQSRHAT